MMGHEKVDLRPSACNIVLMAVPDSLLLGIARVVRSLRLEQGKTARQVAEKAELSLRFYAQIEKGTANISIIRLASLANALSISLPVLIAEAMGRKKCIALLGIRGAGKSSVGQKVAEAKAMEFVELDALIEEKAGFNLTEIFTLHGEDYYRRMETACLNEVLDLPQPTVVALSGGVINNHEAFERIIHDCITIWLRAEPEIYMQRVLAQGDHRPMANRNDAMSELKALAASRQPHYARAEITIDTSSIGIDEIVGQICSEF
ncbi:MAG: shikimate kinase [Planctomycetota bacterium]|nr:shikimate kinase [Planctomycetota bacterium]